MIGSKIKQLRIDGETFLTQEELSELMQVERSTVAKWESENVIPSTQTLIKLAKYFNVTTDYLLGLEDEKRNVQPVIDEDEICKAKIIAFAKEIQVFMEELDNPYYEIRVSEDEIKILQVITCINKTK